MTWFEVKNAANDIILRVIPNCDDPVKEVYNNNLYKAVCDCLVYCYVNEVPRDEYPASTLLEAHHDFSIKGFIEDGIF